MRVSPGIELTSRGLYCEPGRFYIDPWQPVDRALITHAHSDHARWGMKSYLCESSGKAILQDRVGSTAQISTAEYGEKLEIGDATVSFYPAGHILGSSQIRIEINGHVTVVSGDYKTAPDNTCVAFELVKCHAFITESTFGLPIYRWPEQADVAKEINDWWKKNRSEGRPSVLTGYALGKAQRALALLNPDIGPIYLHGAISKMTQHYRDQGIALPQTEDISRQGKGTDWSKSLVIAPPSALGTSWTNRFVDYSDAFLSGWMAIRGARRRRSVDRGFVLSDHVDWPSLLSVIAATDAEKIIVTHGYSDTVVRHLRDLGKDAFVLKTEWEGELEETRELEHLSEEGEVSGSLG